MEEAAANQEFHPQNLIESPEVEEFLKAFDANKRGTALRMLDEEKVLLVDQAYLKKLTEANQVYQANNQALTKALEEVRDDRDTLMKGLYSIYNHFGFIIKAIQVGVKQKKASSLAKVISGLGSAFGFGKKFDTQTSNIIVAIITAIRQNIKKMESDIPDLGEQLMPGLKVLEKHNIIPPIESMEITTENENNAKTDGEEKQQ